MKTALQVSALWVGIVVCLWGIGYVAKCNNCHCQNPDTPMCCCNGGHCTPVCECKNCRCK